MVFQSGVSLALLTSGSNSIKEDVQRLLRERIQIPTGSVAHTSAGSLDAKHLIHVVGPHNGPSQLGLDKGRLLEFAVQNTLKKANDLSCESLSMPAIFAGHFGFPREQCARILLKSINVFQEMQAELMAVDPDYTQSLRKIRLIDSNPLMTQAFMEELSTVR